MEQEQARFLKSLNDRDDQSAVDRIRSEGPPHRVRITEPFRLSRHEVTRGQFRQFVEKTGYKTEAESSGKGGRRMVDGEWSLDPRFVWNTDPGFEQTDDHPVVNVSWNDVIAFCQWLSDKEGAEYALPTEAQWEYACRGGTTTFWHCGDSDTALQEHAWFGAYAGGKTHPVAQLKPNAWGLYDMYGNVAEWCNDPYAADYYHRSPSRNPRGPAGGKWAVIRGGAWDSRPDRCRSAWRAGEDPRFHDICFSRDTTGFRCVRRPAGNPGGLPLQSSHSRRTLTSP